MELNSLTAISPLDGRYRQKLDELDLYFSEFGLIKYRIMVEIEYFIALCDIPLPQLTDFRKEDYKTLRSVYEDFSIEDAQKIKEKEKVTNHDVKAVEYFLKEKFFHLGWERWSEFIHFGLTSQDINNALRSRNHRFIPARRIHSGRRERSSAECRRDQRGMEQGDGGAV